MSGERRARLPGADELFRPTVRDEPARPAVVPGEGEELTDLVELAADPVVGARQGDVPGPALPVGALVRWLASSVGARHAVEVAGRAGTAGLWILPGMAPGGVLTTISADGHGHAASRAALQGAGLGEHVRAIHGAATEVLPRLADASYDLLVWADSTDRPREARDHAERLLRPGGVLVVLDLAAQDGRGRRAVVRDLIDDPSWHVAVLPMAGGVAIARRGE